MHHTTEIKGWQHQSLAAHTVWPGGPHWKGPCQHIPCVTGSRNVYWEGRGATASAIHHVGVFCKLVRGCFKVQTTLPLGSLHHQHTWGNLPEHAKTLTCGLSVSDLEQSFKFHLSFSVTKWKCPKHPQTEGLKRRHESRNEGRGLGSVVGQTDSKFPRSYQYEAPVRENPTGRCWYTRGRHNQVIFLSYLQKCIMMGLSGSQHCYMAVMKTEPRVPKAGLNYFPFYFALPLCCFLSWAAGSHTCFNLHKLL